MISPDDSRRGERQVARDATAGMFEPENMIGVETLAPSWRRAVQMNRCNHAEPIWAGFKFV
ncbi:hypothetical protein CUJ84_Chr000635 [Rhizobium leguminosarum]|uniref:Uncharacterized protein n=1 Tax=Rhizobium leguminosarum TaxID=384 RepID=A0A2K9YYH4_RHILE|nr:hypothetical protein CUJ84_Chr000635 [Rhizobium leguminosarum]